MTSSSQPSADQKIEEMKRRIKGAMAALKQATDDQVVNDASVWDMRDFCAEALRWLQSGEPFYGAGKGYEPGCYNTQEELQDHIDKMELALRPAEEGGLHVRLNLEGITNPEHFRRVVNEIANDLEIQKEAARRFISSTR